MNMDTKTRIAYAEVMQVLKYFDRNQVMKVPIEIVEYFKENQDKNYISKIDKEDIFNKNNISREALAILAYLNLTYWANEEEKKELKSIYRKNEHIDANNDYNTILRSKNNNSEIEKTRNFENAQMIQYKESKLKKIFDRIKSFFKRFKKK